MFSDPVLLLPPAFLPTAAYYAAMLASRRAVIDSGMRYDKRAKSVHRTFLQTTHGVTNLTVPVERPVSSRTSWDTVNVSGHGQWWRTMRSTLATVFGATPFFEYYRDRFDAELSENAVGKPVTSLDFSLDAALRRLLRLPTLVSAATDSRDRVFTDLRRTDFMSGDLEIPGYTISLPDELAPGRTILEPLFRLGADETRRLLQESLKPRS